MMKNITKITMLSIGILTSNALFSAPTVNKATSTTKTTGPASEKEDEIISAALAYTTLDVKDALNQAIVAGALEAGTSKATGSKKVDSVSKVLMDTFYESFSDKENQEDLMTNVFEKLAQRIIEHTNTLKKEDHVELKKFAKERKEKKEKRKKEKAKKRSVKK